ncbi:exosortase A [Sphingomonas sanguinis]|uniref:exosortase A n=1 Tax=Sphingomonas sp. LC-1 TaxID=3110957 RepID=UPI0021BB88B9|nr:exosortase A [Sphingomonas sp. LC-1]MCT8003466.1 exosortase A [Sphingomonas sp. LC-1]
MTLAQRMKPGRWTYHLALLGVTALIVLLLFWRDAAHLVDIWWTSTTYGHCLFIGPVIGWLIWQRRSELAQLTPVAWWPGLIAVAGGGLLWLLGESATVALVRQLGLVAVIEGLVLTLLGPMVARGLLFPLAYAWFLVPFGAELERPLQRITVSIVMPLLDWSGIPASADGVLIHAGRYWFEVAEACSGSKFVLAMIAFATLVANLCFKSPWRRGVFLIVSLIVPVLANGVRAWGTIFAADKTSIEVAGGVDHIIFGWVFFAAVMAAVLAIGWQFFDRSPDDPAFDPRRLSAMPGHRIDPLLAAILAVTITALYPTWSGFAGSRTAILPGRMTLPDVPGWTTTTQVSAWQPYYPGADAVLLRSYSDGDGHQVDLAVAVFSRQREGGKLGAFGTGVLHEDDRWIRVADLGRIAGGDTMRIISTGANGRSVQRDVATWYRIGDRLTPDMRRVKIETMKARLLGQRQTAMAIHVASEGDDPAAIQAFVHALGPVEDFADRLTGRH